MSEIINENQNKKNRLGRGLGSLLGGSSSLDTQVKSSTGPEVVASQKDSQLQKPATTQAIHAAGLANQVAPSPARPAEVVPAEARIWQVAIDKLAPGEFQPRSHFDKEKLAELSASIKQNGILQPIVARKLISGRYEIIAGERRWRAAQLAGMHQVPVILKDLEDQATLEMAIIENVQREDLNPVEEAEAYQKLAAEFKLTQQQIADKVGKDRATVANAMRLLALPNAVRDLLVQGEISAGHAKVLLSLTSALDQLEFAKLVQKQKVSVRQLEKMVAQKNNASAEEENEEKFPSLANAGTKLVKNMAEDLQKILATKVTIDYLNGKGKLTVHFYSDDELNNVVEKLKEAKKRI